MIEDHFSRDYIVGYHCGHNTVSVNLASDGYRMGLADGRADARAGVESFLADSAGPWVGDKSIILGAVVYDEEDETLHLYYSTTAEDKASEDLYVWSGTAASISGGGWLRLQV